MLFLLLKNIWHVFSNVDMDKMAKGQILFIPALAGIRKYLKIQDAGSALARP